MFDEICNKIISPPKFRYSLYDLGATVTKWGKRTDFHIHNHKHLKMNCSLYEPHKVQFQRACIVYLHSMNGSRLQGSVYVQHILKQGVSFCTFDFSGCGNSDGDKISFGANEKHDIEALVNKLKESFYLNRFILWGRSMGSASAIKYSEMVYDKSRTLLSYQNEEIIGLILDSSFKSFSKLLVEIGHTQSEIPKFIVQAGFFIIRNTLQSNGQFKISDLDLMSDSGLQSSQEKYPLQKLQSLHLPILFLASKQDKTVSYQHSVDMFHAYKSKSKELKFFKGLHNQSRQQDYVFEVVSFIRKVLKKEEKSQNLLEEKLVTQQSIQEPYKYASLNKTVSKQKSQKGKNSLFKLIEQQSSNQQTSTLFELESVQNTCVCTMFDNELAKHQNQQPYRQRQKSYHFKESKPSQSNFKENFNSDQTIQKTNENQSKVKKSISDNSNGNPGKHFDYHGPNYSKENPSGIYFVETVASLRGFKKIGQSMDLKWKKMEENDYTGINKEGLKLFDELYSPLRVQSERSLKLKQSLKGQ